MPTMSSGGRQFWWYAQYNFQTGNYDVFASRHDDPNAHQIGTAHSYLEAEELAQKWAQEQAHATDTGAADDASRD